MALAVNRSIDIDFGISTQQTVLTGWNNFTGAPDVEPTTTLNLTDSTGEATGISLTPAWSAMNFDTGINSTLANFEGPYPMELAGIPQSALRDGLFVRDARTLTLTLNNLPANTGYNFLFYGAAGNLGDYSLFTVTGSNTRSDFITGLVNNSDEVATVNGIIPNAMQRITIRFEGRRPDGSLQDPSVNDDGLGRFNYMRILQHSLMPGDFDANMMVDAADYATWQSDFGLLAHATGADGNRNGIVDAADYALWRKAVVDGAGGAALASSNEQSVPEPHAALLLAAAALSVCGFRLAGRRRGPR